MKQRQLGSDGPMVSAIGLGCMSFGGIFGATDDAASLACLDAAYENGITFYDTANIYGPLVSERVLGHWIATRRPDIVLATKGGIVPDPARRANNEPAYLRAELEASLQRLGVERVDLYYIHRRDVTVPLEDVIGVMADLVAEGKIGGYGLSEVAPHTIRLAHAIHPCRAVQNEYSLWTRQPELGVVQTCEELGIAFVPFSPLARGALTPVYPDVTIMGPTDIRPHLPRFSDQNYPRNKAIIDRFRAYCAARQEPVTRVALAWVLRKGAGFLPIPGTRTADHLKEWVTADQLDLTEADMAEIETILPIGFAHGDRYADSMLKAVERYC